MDLNISIVSYLNSIPFVSALENTEFSFNINLSKDIPADCAAKLIDGTVDIGLIPVAVLPKIKNAQIISDFCIGSEGEVATVLLLSDSPINEIKDVYLDTHSRTSVELVKILFRDFWKVVPEYKSLNYSKEFVLPQNSAMLLIGDKVFGTEKKYEYSYDLGAAWTEFTGLPFTYACLVSNKHIPESIISELNDAFAISISSLSEIVNQFDTDIINKEELITYLETKIDFNLNAKKSKAIDLFLSLI